MYFTGAGHPPKRSQTTHDTSRAGRSPLRGPTTPTSNALLDPYSQQAQYSPTTAASYSYGTSQDRPPPSATYSHNRTHSQVKAESPSASPY
ncbi:hypothetical protein BDN72DRAFT_740109, partial [Pluteus cervinus]